MLVMRSSKAAVCGTTLFREPVFIFKVQLASRSDLDPKKHVKQTAQNLLKRAYLTKVLICSKVRVRVQTMGLEHWGAQQPKVGMIYIL